MVGKRIYQSGGLAGEKPITLVLGRKPPSGDRVYGVPSAIVNPRLAGGQFLRTNLLPRGSSIPEMACKPESNLFALPEAVACRRHADCATKVLDVINRDRRQRQGAACIRRKRGGGLL